MRKLFFAIAAVAAVGFIAPVTTQASAETVIIKKGGHRHHDMHRGHAKKVVIIKRGGRRHHMH